MAHLSFVSVALQMSMAYMSHRVLATGDSTDESLDAVPPSSAPSAAAPAAAPKSFVDSLVFLKLSFWMSYIDGAVDAQRDQHWEE